MASKVGEVRKDTIKGDGRAQWGAVSHRAGKAQTEMVETRSTASVEWLGTRESDAVERTGVQTGDITADPW